MTRWLVIDVAGLGSEWLEANTVAAPFLQKLARRGWRGAVKPAFPAVTCASQATFTTGAAPEEHGVVGNGWLDRRFARVSFWEQSDALVAGEKIWDRVHRAAPDRRTAMLFWQNSIGSANDVILTPQPIHKHSGGMFQSCWSRPAGYYGELVRRLGPFKLHWYWGPVTSIRGSAWIARATLAVLDDFQPNLALTYLPHLDYGLQKWGPLDPRCAADLAQLDAVIAELCDGAAARGYEICLFADYTIHSVQNACTPNRALRDAGLLTARTVGGLEYLDAWNSRALAVTDHQVAHVYLPRPAGASADVAVLAEARAVLESLPGVERVLSVEEQRDLRVAHDNAGDLIAIAQKDAWFWYPWWHEDRLAPDYARHIDIHAKPGYDPMEMFMEFWPRGEWRPRLLPAVSFDVARIRGSHGRPPSEPADDGALLLTHDVGLPRGIALVDLGRAIVP